MTGRRPANSILHPLFNMLEQRFALQLHAHSALHLQNVIEHYDAKRAFLLAQHGETSALAQEEYAKAVLISETARLMLREIAPRPRRKKFKKELS